MSNAAVFGGASTPSRRTFVIVHRDGPYYISTNFDSRKDAAAYARSLSGGCNARMMMVYYANNRYEAILVNDSSGLSIQPQ